MVYRPARLIMATINASLRLSGSADLLKQSISNSMHEHSSLENLAILNALTPYPSPKLSDPTPSSSEEVSSIPVLIGITCQVIFWPSFLVNLTSGRGHLTGLLPPPSNNHLKIDISASEVRKFDCITYYNRPPHGVSAVTVLKSTHWPLIPIQSVRMYVR
jgi:hypothetical protein